MMLKAPQILFAANSPLREQIEAIPWKNLGSGALDLDELLADRDTGRVLFLTTNEAQLVWRDVEELAIDRPVYPLIVSDGSSLAPNSSAFLRLAPMIQGPVVSLTVEDTVLELLQRCGRMHLELSAVDPDTQLLTQNALCEWERSSVGIVGLVRITANSSVESLAEQLELLRSNAYAAIDRVPTARLSTEDLWALLLLVSAPWKRKEIEASNERSAVLRSFVSDVRGSRKLVMSADESIKTLLGPVESSTSHWTPTSDNPLRDELAASIHNPDELKALEILFNKRHSAEDFARLLSVLGRRS